MVPGTHHHVSALDFQSLRTGRMCENKHKVSEFHSNEKELKRVCTDIDPFHSPTSVVIVLFKFEHLVVTLKRLGEFILCTALYPTQTHKYPLSPST